MNIKIYKLSECESGDVVQFLDRRYYNNYNKRYKAGETPEMTLRRMEKERKFN
jgi:hypothetical protein